MCMCMCICDRINRNVSPSIYIFLQVVEKMKKIESVDRDNEYIHTKRTKNELRTKREKN